MMGELRGNRRHRYMVVIGLAVAATTLLLQNHIWMEAEPNHNKAGTRDVEQQQASSSVRLQHHHDLPNQSSFGEQSHHEDATTTRDETKLHATTVATSPTRGFSNQTSREDVHDGRAVRSEIHIPTTVARIDERGPTSNDTAAQETERSPTWNDNATNETSTTGSSGFDLSNQTFKDDVHEDSLGRTVGPDVNTSTTLAQTEERNPAKESISTNESSTLMARNSSAITDMSSLYAANKSSVDYYACCGAGHRLIRTANAYHLAREINFGLRVFWGWCDDIEVYHHLFGPEPIEDLANVTSLNQRTVASNEVGGFDGYQGSLRPDGTCQCTEAKIQHDIQFYSSLRDRFSQRDQVDDFVRQHFDNAPLVLGMHIRAGNNETGDFTNKGRGIHNMTEWLDHVVEHVKSLLHHRRRPDLDVSMERDVNASQQHPPVLFVASDTPSMVPRLQSMFSTESLQVLAFPHVVATKEGTGVSFGEHGAPTPEGRECVLAWESVFLDMMILSHVDILVSPRYSSFSQSIPLSLVFAQRQNRTMMTTTTTTTASASPNTPTTASASPNTTTTTLPPAACFMDYNAVTMKCYPTFLEWCCDHPSLQSIVLKFPNEDLFSNRTWLQMEPRSAQCDLVAPHYPGCIPFPLERAPKVDEEQTRNFSSSVATASLAS